MSTDSNKYLYKTLYSVQKWCNGEQKKVNRINELIPQYHRYIDPFFGTGINYFTIKPSAPSFVNNTNEELYELYNFLKTDEFKIELDCFIDSWQLIKDYFKLINKDAQWSFNELITNDITLDELPYIIRAIIITNTENPLVNNLFKPDFIIDLDSFINLLIDELLKKLKRLYFQNKRKGIEYTKPKLDPHIETSIKNAYFLHFRNLYYDINKRGNNKVNKEKKVAIWLILMILGKKQKVDDKCISSFTYGGNSFNHKNLRFLSSSSISK
ncbi:MAG: hypothetical protein GXO79_09510, partial [Chlorobi bacterium]|nr:hypothetical protein [Chlorobiota bacterium]